AADSSGWPSPWKPWERGAIEPLVLEAKVGRGEQIAPEEGEVILRATAERFSGPLRRPAPVVVEKRVAVRLTPPSLQLLSSQHYVRQGGAGLVVARIGETAIRSGVVAGEEEFLSYPVPGAAESERLTLFGVPWNVADPSRVRLFAEDDAGNRSELAFIDLLAASPPRRDTIDLPDSFLERVVPAIESRTPTLTGKGPLIERYLEINGPLRAQNRQRIAELSRDSRQDFLWKGAFLQLPNSQVRARYAETRTYRYQGRAVDTQTHLGLDVASLARAEAPAPNDGRVVYAEYLGIYGNVVVLDHGFGLLSLNAHLSSIDVAVGQDVIKGETIGRSGATGLAGGDHLHLGIFVQGTAVDPVQWIDAKWIRDNIGTKIRLP
ncbi:MAG: M23 family metallopeptidase, partial [Acidobacteriota bacterium]